MVELMKLKGKVALVTGGAVRIGRAISESLAEHGVDVCVHYRNSEREAKELKRILQDKGSRVFLLKADLSSEAECDLLVQKAREAAGGLDILVNNASVFTKQTINEATTSAIESEFRTNLYAPMHLMRAFAGTCSRGKIVNLLDRRITSLDHTCVPYLLSKKALAEVTKLAALEWAPGITVNGVAPGAVLPPPGKGEDYMKDFAGFVPLGRQVTPGEVADAVLFVLRSDALTGQIIFVDGGQHMKS